MGAISETASTRARTVLQVPSPRRHSEPRRNASAGNAYVIMIKGIHPVVEGVREANNTSFLLFSPYLACLHSICAMSGFEVVASSAGLVSLSLTLFKGCIQAFQFVETAANLGSDADIIRCKLEWEQYRLYQWAEQVGLEARPNARLNWTLASNILKQLECLLTSSKELKERYCVDVVDLGENALVRDGLVARRIGFGLLLSKLKPNYTLTSSRILQESNAPLKKLEWAAVGKDKLYRLVEDIGYFNKCLHGLLECSDRNFVTAGLAALLRDIISRSNVSSELDVVKELLRSTSVASPEALASAASLKKIRLILGLGNNSNGVQQQTTSIGNKLKLTYLKPKHLIRESKYKSPREREIARYKSDVVLIEWRFFDKKSEQQLKGRVDQLAILLGNTDETSFRSLHCMGVLPKENTYQPEDDAQVCYGLVFDLRLPRSKSPSTSAPAILALSDLYEKRRKPSLNERLCIAIDLAEAVLQLHTTGWLHKGFRPNNILFVETCSQMWEAGTAKGPYLAGYVYARPSNAETEMVYSQPVHDLYRHPLAQGTAKQNFKKSFDMFALGCILLEVALWESFRDIITRISEKRSGTTMDEKHPAGLSKGPSSTSEWAQIHAAKDQLLHNAKKGSDLADVAFHVGETYEEVILLCLHCPTDDPDDEDLETQKRVVEKLRDCRF